MERLRHFGAAVLRLKRWTRLEIQLLLERQSWINNK